MLFGKTDCGRPKFLGHSPAASWGLTPFIDLVADLENIWGSGEEMDLSGVFMLGLWLFGFLRP